MTRPSVPLLVKQPLTKLFRSQAVATPHALLCLLELLLPWPPGGCVHDPEQADGLGTDLQELLFCRRQFSRGFKHMSWLFADDTGRFFQLSSQGKVPVHGVK